MKKHHQIFVQTLSFCHIFKNYVASIDAFSPTYVTATDTINKLGKSCLSFVTHSRCIPSNNFDNFKWPLFGILPLEYDDEPNDNLMLAEKMTLDADKTAKLARLAVAFSPAEQKLSLADLDSVHVVCVDEEHIEISAVLCEEECVSVLVPLTFPHSCDVNIDMEECVFENVEELDVVAGVKISEMKKESEGKCDESNDDFHLYAHGTPYDFPDWWLQASDDELGISLSCSIDLDDECGNIARLLNEEDFKEDLVSLATQGLFDSIGMDGEDYQIQKAIVTHVGPMGVCLRTKAKKKTDNQFKIIDVPVAFGREPAKDINDLRAAVLGAVAAVHID